MRWHSRPYGIAVARRISIARRITVGCRITISRAIGIGRSDSNNWSRSIPRDLADQRQSIRRSL